MTPPSLLAADHAAAIPLLPETGAAPASIVSHTLLQTSEARVIRFDFAAGQELTTHTNRRRALIQLLCGRCEFFFNDRWQPLAAGTLLHLPPNHPHAVRAVEACSLLLTLCAEPVAPATAS